MLEKFSSPCTKLIINRDQLVKYLGFHMPELEIIYPICAKGCRKIRDAEFLEDIRYRMPLLKRTYIHCGIRVLIIIFVFI